MTCCYDILDRKLSEKVNHDCGRLVFLYDFSTGEYLIILYDNDRRNCKGSNNNVEENRFVEIKKGDEIIWDAIYTYMLRRK